MNWRMGKLRVDVVMVGEVRETFRDAPLKSFNIELREIMVFDCIVLYCIVDERVTWW